MIGQERLRTIFKDQLDAGTLPQFIILVGRQGSGRKTLIRSVFGKDGYWLQNVSITSVRDMIDGSYRYHDTMFVIPDADTMSMQAKQALLKVCEECPNNNRYIMSLENLEATLAPIRSRAAVYFMDRYTSYEIERYTRWYLKGYNPKTEKWSQAEEQTVQMYKEVCDTPGDVIALHNFGGREFYTYVEKVVDNIDRVSGANAFKISDKLSMKDDDGKYDLRLFFKVFMMVCISRFKTGQDDEEVLKYAGWCSTTSKYLAELGITGINKQALADNWILELREIAAGWTYRN